MRPTNLFEEFRKEDTEQTISSRFEAQARRYPHRLAVKTKSQKFSYDALNRLSNRAAHAILAINRGGAPVVLLFKQGGAASGGEFRRAKARQGLCAVGCLAPPCQGSADPRAPSAWSDCD